MKPLTRLLITAALSMTWAGDASAMNGSALHWLCDPIRVGITKDVLTHTQFGALNISMCFGYIEGIKDITFGRDYCLPSGRSFDIRAKVVLAYLNEHPERTHKSAAILVDEAFAQAYPCPAKPNGKDRGW
jgi:hypothetical protein